ncbi:MAG: GNAT family N-acetyltransferase [Actinomycetota bacterium]
MLGARPVPPSEALLRTGLRWRPIEDADAAAERFAEDDLHDELLGGSWKDPRLDSLLGVDPDGVPRAFGHVEVRPGDTRTVRAFCWGGVHPRWRRRGIGRAVLAWQEDVGRRKIAATGRHGPARLLVHAEEQAVDRRRLAARAGFAPVRWYVDMSRSLGASPPHVPHTDGVRIVPFHAELSERVRLAHNESFAEHWGSEPRSEEDWARSTVGTRHFRADWSFVVLDGDRVAAYTLASAYRQDWEAQGYTCGWTDLLGARPAWRGRRLAPALLAASMRAMAASGMQRADIGVDSENASGALQLYTSLGYEPQRRSVAYAKEIAPQVSPPMSTA